MDMLNGCSSAPQVSTSTAIDGGREVIVTGCVTKQGRAIHFCNHKLLSGSNNNLWFPVDTVDDWFSGIERVLVMNGLAENVVNLTPLIEGSEYFDWKVKYNLRVI